MAGGNFMHRVLSYVVNELVVNGLANSPAFQRFAVKTSRRIDDISNLGMFLLHFVVWTSDCSLYLLLP
ncbi:UvrABC system protein [Salix suchowensis]|nr:UvrABC system protein [Salix suchowensis]